MEGSEGMKRGRRNMNRFSSEDRGLPSVRHGDYIYREVLISSSLFGFQGFTSDIHCTRGRTCFSSLKLELCPFPPHHLM